jgi:hypothetical protein
MWSGSAVSTASYDADDTPDRDWINAALVFRIPAYATAGNCYADIAIHVGPFAPATSTQRFTAKSAMCRFIPRRSLKILLARIGWAHGGFGADLSGVKGLLDTFPIPDGEVEFVLPVRTMLTNADLQDATKEDHDTWEDALDDLVDAAEDWEGERDLVLGSLSTDVELVLNGIADPTERVCFALDDRPATIAHEVAHLFGVHHANCGDDIEDVDSRLPSDGQFGENVFRPQSLVLYDQPMKDLMSYCWPNGNKHTFTMDTEMDYQDRQISPELWRLLLKVLP